MYFIRNHEVLIQGTSDDSKAGFSFQLLGVKNDEANKYFISREDFFAFTKFYRGLNNFSHWSVRILKEHEIF